MKDLKGIDTKNVAAGKAIRGPIRLHRSSLLRL
jgi:hypothetical protein